MPPASLAKLMTSAVVFDAVEAGRLSLDDSFVVSENAWREGGANSGGSTMFGSTGTFDGGGTSVGNSGNINVSNGSGGFSIYAGITCATHRFLNAIDVSGTLSSDCVQPAFSEQSAVAIGTSFPRDGPTL